MNENEESLNQFRTLIKAQDLLRSVYCEQTGKASNVLRDLDKQMSKAINSFAESKGIISVSGTAKKI